MVFSSILFLFTFLPIVLFLYYIAPGKLKNLILLISSFIFYAWGEPVYIVLMIFSALVDYSHGILIDKYRENKKLCKLILLSSIVINIGLLSFFKYYDFILNSINSLIGTSFKGLGLPLPIGISFYTFQTMSYTIDVYRNEVAAQRNIITFAAYVSLFPQLIAGPIVRYSEVEEQLDYRIENFDIFGEGVRRFAVGLGKKVLLANNIGLLWEQIKIIPINELPLMTAWLGILAFSFQIYFDFSGYSDIAIGLGKMFGFTFLENFNYPYISKSITEFWRRWHISLGTWFREYVYFPLGGSRRGKTLLYRNLMIVWFLTGLWHGASWNFVFWGLYFGIIIALEKAFVLKWLNSVPDSISHFYSIILILIGWALFAFDNLHSGIGYLKAMFGINGTAFYDNQSIYYLYTHGLLLIILVVASTPLFKNLAQKFKRFKLSYPFGAFSYAMIIFLSIAYLVDASYNPFLYFRF